MKTQSVILTLVFVFCAPQIVLSQHSSTVTQSVTIEVKAITKIAVTGNPESLFIVDLNGSSDVLTVSDSKTKYSMLTNLENTKIVASINDPMPQGTRLMLKLDSQRGVSDGFVDISGAVAPVDVVTGIGKGSDLNQAITYSFAADASVRQIDSDARIITLTLSN